MIVPNGMAYRSAACYMLCAAVEAFWYTILAPAALSMRVVFLCRAIDSLSDSELLGQIR
ncbi:hypothetical protein BT63DRAFT_310146 [Microthyrium microscopicum]|uniref:Uncharacterized protein n=1 Tax=Microthyrium microscopicum TaxID=703497 RepID=A0A6A6U2Y3_9PEZI|nr:hypothetical protein BT63DRAFT_310146 [Microthyrium microscopicum]